MAFFKKRLGLTRLSCKCLVLALIIEIYGLYSSVCVRSLKASPWARSLMFFIHFWEAFISWNPSVCYVKRHLVSSFSLHGRQTRNCQEFVSVSAKRQVIKVSEWALCRIPSHSIDWMSQCIACHPVGKILSPSDNFMQRAHCVGQTQRCRFPTHLYISPDWLNSDHLSQGTRPDMRRGLVWMIWRWVNPHFCISTTNEAFGQSTRV